MAMPVCCRMEYLEAFICSSAMFAFIMRLYEASTLIWAVATESSLKVKRAIREPSSERAPLTLSSALLAVVMYLPAFVALETSTEKLLACSYVKVALEPAEDERLAKAAIWIVTPRPLTKFPAAATYAELDALFVVPSAPTRLTCRPWP